MKPPINTKNLGHEAESKALHFLQKNGLRLIERNFYCKLGEIDLIMRDKHSVVFVEVRMRKNPNFGSAQATVTRRKQIKIIKTATYYLQRNPKLAQMACRFDVIALESNINWIQNAFQTTEWA